MLLVENMTLGTAV